MSTFIYSHQAAAFARDELGFTPDAGQAELLATRHRLVILNCHRQWGKTTVTAIRAAHQAVQEAKQSIVIVSPPMRQSRALANRCREFASRSEIPFGRDGTNARSLLFPNVLSTPKGRSDFFYQEWMAKDTTKDRWLRISGPVAESSARVDADFLASERRRKTAEQFAEEYDCGFLTAGRTVFAEEWLERSFSAEVPIFDWNSREDLRLARHRPVYFLSLDVGKLRDHAALVLLEYRVAPTGRRDAATFQPLYKCEVRVVYIERFRLQTSYRELVDRVSRLCHHPHLAGHTTLILDATGQGLPAVEMFRDARLPVTLLPVTITGGKPVVVSGSSRSVPKANLVASLEVLLERGFLKIASQLPHADLLREELRQFEGWRERVGAVKYGAASGHDDLAMAAALGAWWVWTNRRGSLTGDTPRILD